MGYGAAQHRPKLNAIKHTKIYILHHFENSNWIYFYFVQRYHSPTFSYVSIYGVAFCD